MFSTKREGASNSPAKRDWQGILKSKNQVSSNFTEMKKINQNQKSLDMCSFNQIPACYPAFPPLKSTATHHVAFDVNTLNGTSPPSPISGSSVDQWDKKRHVQMPFLSKDALPSPEKKTSASTRWDSITKALEQPLDSSEAIEYAIKSYNPGMSRFGCLRSFFDQILTGTDRDKFFNETLPKMRLLVLRLPELFPQPLPLLLRNQPHCVTVSQEQCACLLANAFFCTFPGRNGLGFEYDHKVSPFPVFGFDGLYYQGFSKKTRGYKLLCLVNYFTRVTTSMPTGAVSFERRVITSRQFPSWQESSMPLCNLEAFDEGRIEDAHGFLQADFANQYLGGGVLEGGCVQEEIRFCVNPELMVSMLITEVLGDNEAVIMTGCEQFNRYRGYGGSFEWEGDFIDKTERDTWQRRYVQVVAMDAIPLGAYDDQFSSTMVRRELNKAFAALYCPSAPEHKSAIATGNWGCGAFGGDKRLKALIQIMAASVCQRNVVYFTFNDSSFREELLGIHKMLTERQKTVGDVWNIIEQYSSGRKGEETLFDFIKKGVSK